MTFFCQELANISTRSSKSITGEFEFRASPLNGPLLVASGQKLAARSCQQQLTSSRFGQRYQ